MPQDTLYQKEIESLNYQLQSVDSIKTDRPLVLYNYLKQSDNQKVFNLPIEVVFTSIIIPLFAFALGLMISWIRERWKETVKGKANEKYFMTWSDIVRKNVGRQSNTLKEVSKSLLDVDGVSNYQTFNFHIDKVKEISAVDLYKALVLLKRGNKTIQNTLYHKALNTLDFFQRKYEECLLMIKKVGEEQAVANKEWSVGLQELNTLRLKYITAKNRKIQGDIFLVKFYDIHEGMRAIKETRENLFRYYVEPIDRLCNEFLNSTPSDHRVLEVTKISSQLAASYILRKNVREKYSLDFFERNKQLEKSLNEFAETCSLIQRTRFRII